MKALAHLFRPKTRSSISLEFPGLPEHTAPFLHEFVRNCLHLEGWHKQGWQLLRVERWVEASK